MTSLTITLYYTSGSSDKEYQLSVSESAAGHIVVAQYGPRGRATRLEQKTPSPVPESAAMAMFGKVLAEKKKKGYTTSVSGTPFGPVAVPPRTASPASSSPAPGVSSAPRTGFVVPLELSAADLDAYLEEDDWVLQPISAQELLLVQKSRSSKLVAANRMGVMFSLPPALESLINGMFSSVVLEGFLDATTNALVVTDGFSDARPGMAAIDPFSQRWDSLLTIISDKGSALLETVPVYTGEDKSQACALLQDTGRVGVVLKHVNKPYVPGKQVLTKVTALTHHF